MLFSYTNKSTFNNKARFILIDNIENLNKNSVNALLKITEEPNKNLYFIDAHECQVVNLARRHATILSLRRRSKIIFSILIEVCLEITHTEMTM